MANSDELRQRFWQELKAHPTCFLGLEREHGQARPMTAQLPDGPQAVWFFSSTESDLVRNLQGKSAAVLQYVAKDLTLYASLTGEIILDNDRVMVERLWNRFVAAWYPGGKDDPKLALLRLMPERLHVWLNDVGLLTGVKIFLGADPRKELAGSESETRA